MPNSLSRRAWLRWSFAMAGATAAVNLCDWCEAIAAEPASSLPPLNRFPRMVHEYFVNEVKQAQRRAEQALGRLQTTDDAEKYLQQVRDKIARSFGPFPERTPLNARVTGVVERDAYRIEKVIFESRPRFYVTANLYLPKEAKTPVPGVVGPCGHADNAKAFGEYQSFAQGLARQGYAVLVYDPIGQGERLQFADEQLKSRVGTGSREHSMLGNSQFLVGEFFGAWRAWDGIRALDYLLSRDEVDRRHIGVTGNSGGGCLTTWLCGLDRRWTMAAPNCFVTTFGRLLENETSTDTEQCPPGAIAADLGHAEFLAALAPKPIIVLAEEKDFVDIRGTIEAFERLRRIYSLLGAADQVKLHIGPGEHGYPRESREALYGWFNRATQLGHAGDNQLPSEPPLTLEEDQTLWCTKSGQVAELQSRPVYSFTKEIAQQWQAMRGTPDGLHLRAAAADLLNLPERHGPVDFRILRPHAGRGYPLPRTSAYALETEPGMFAVVYRLGQTVHYSRPPKQANQALLYVAHDSSDAELRDEPLVRELLESNPAATLYACDVRGLGESRGNTFGDNSYALFSGSDYNYAVHAIMLDRPYVGGRTHDVLCVLDWLHDIGHADVHLAAKGYGTIPAAFAALFHNAATQVTLKHALTTYHDIASADIYKWPLSSLTPGVLKHFDMPDVYRELKSKKLRLIDSWDFQFNTG